MKRFLTSIAFCLLVLTLGIIAFSPRSIADSNLAEKLLDLPAPPPPNPFHKPRGPVRDPSFYDPEKPPDEDAPIEDLVDYYLRQNQADVVRGVVAKPNDKVLRRLMNELAENPERLPQFLNLFEGNKDAIEFVKRLYDSELINRDFEKDWRESVKTWLTFNSPYFSDQLAQVARTVRDEDEYVTNQNELLALAKVDWDKAEPLLNRLANDSSQPVSQTLARWAYYQHALDQKDSFEADKWRELLKKTVEDKSAKPGNRDLAMDALVRGGDFEGRDEWYMSLLEDETLHDLRVNGRSYTGLTTIVSYSPEGKYTAKMIELLKSSSKSIRSAAIRNLASSGAIKSEEAVREMLPWLEDPKWANDVNGSRRLMISALKEFKMPESVPGLISILADRDRYRSTVLLQSSNANVAVPTPADQQAFRSIYEFRTFIAEVVGALGNQRDPRAVPELRAVLPEFEAWQRQQVVKAILNCNGFSVFEQVDGVEYFARANVVREESIKAEANTVANMAVSAKTNADAVSDSVTVDPSELKMMLGIVLNQNDDPSADLVSAMQNRIDSLEKKEPLVAASMRDVLRNWRGVAVNALLMRIIRNGKAELPDLLKVLARRAEIRRDQMNDIYDMRGGVPLAVGFSACLIEQNAEYDAVLDGDNNEMKTVALGCARLIRAKLPVGKVAELLNTGDKLLTAAAEKYLESEDSADARGIVLARHPNEARVLGARTSFPGKAALDGPLLEVFASVQQGELMEGFVMAFDALDKVEEKLRTEVIGNPDLLGVYSFDNNFVRIYADKAVFSWEEDPARFRERTLNENEFERLKGYLLDSRVDDLPPFLTYCGEYCGSSRELLMLGRSGGRRVFQLGYDLPPFFQKLTAIFEDLRRPPAKLQYYTQRRVPGLEIIFEDENLDALAVWKNGPDLRVLTDNKTKREQIEKELKAQDSLDEENEKLEYEEAQERRRKRREARAFENLTWFRFGNGRPIALAEQPSDFSFVPTRDRLAVQPNQLQWKARTATLEVRAGSDGLFKVVRGQMTRLRAGYYDLPLVTPNGRWVIAKRHGGELESEEDSYGVRIVRVNLLTGKEFPVKFESYPPLQPIAYVAGQGKVLLGTTYGYGENEDSEFEEFRMPEPTYQQFYWLDPETGALSVAKGNVAPLAQQKFRPLQQVTGKPDEFWAAIPDEEKNQTEIGLFNHRTLIFKPVKTLPQIEFNSMRLWIDEAENKAYFAYSGHLLSVPLK
jgi:hypothetical protein